MSIYIISNREVKEDDNTFKNKGKEKVDEARPVFRIAKCELDHEKKNVTYEILKDEFPFDYSAVTNKLKREAANRLKAVNNDTSFKGSSALFHDLYQQMYATNRKEKCSDILCFIPGYANSFKDNLKHIYTLYDLYISPEDSPIEHLIYISYPTRNHKFLTYWSDQKDAEATGRIIGRMYEKTQSFFYQLFQLTDLNRCGHKIHLAAHSMGNQVIQYMMESIPERKLLPLFEEVLLLHADVPNDLFEPGKAFSKLDKIANRTHVFIHKSDFALRISEVTKNPKKRLGRFGPSNKSSLSVETIIVDVSENDSSVSAWEGIIDHWGYIKRGEEIQDIKQVLSGVFTERIQGRKKKRGLDHYYHV